MVEKQGRTICALIMLALIALALSACDFGGETASSEPQGPDLSRYLAAVEDEPDTVDFQCTTIHYTIATNVFNRLVEMEMNKDGSIEIVPSLAESWDVSDDSRTYTFRLREGVTFSNGAALTSSDVRYSFERLLTHPDSCNQDIVAVIDGADRLASGKADELKGFRIVNDREFSITLTEPFEAFLACISMPGASIMDEETTEAAGDRFGKEAKSTIGTGSYIITEWTPGDMMILAANPNCWEGAPNNDGLRLLFTTEQEEIRALFDEGKLDVMNLDDIDSSAEFYIHGDIYQDRLYQVNRVAINYIALNETVEPLQDVNVRKALQYALNRQTLLDAIYNGTGEVENGIYPHGLYGFNPDLEEIPFDVEQAKDLLAQAGYPDGFDLTIRMRSSSTEWEVTMMRLVAAMWEKIGVHAKIKVLSEEEFMKLRTSGRIECYEATWTADYNDPDNFIYTFFGSPENTKFRSLCYTKKDVMKRVRRARAITNDVRRLEEYRNLEKIIVQEDAAWIPLFSRAYLYVTSERVENLETSWNGSVKNRYRDIRLRETP